MSKMDHIPLPYKTLEEKRIYEQNQLINCYNLPLETPIPHDNKGVSCFIDGYLTATDTLSSRVFSPLYSIDRMAEKTSFSPKDYLPDWAMENMEAKGSKNPGNEFHFENESEQRVYSKTHPNTSVVFLSPDDYLEFYKKGYLLVKYDHFQKAIDFLEYSIKLNPIAIKARFELIEARLRINSIPDIESRLHKKRFNEFDYHFDPDAFKSAFATAKAELLRMSVFLYQNCDIAKFYRKMGFIEAGFLNFKTALACYNYSLNFENHYSVKYDLEDIVKLSKKTKPLKRKPCLSKRPEEYLNSAGIPVLNPIESER